MGYITAADINPFINEDQLDVLLGEDYNSLTPYIEATQVEFESYLSAKFDTTTIFAQQGQLRNALLVKYFVDVVIYNLWVSKSPNMVPDARKISWEAALKWLKMAAAGQVTPDLPLRQLSGENPPEQIGHKRGKQRDFEV